LGTNTKINFVQITVSEHNFKLNKKFKLSKNGIPVDIRFDVKTSFSRDKKTITSILSAILFSKTKNPPFTMKVSVEGIFISENIKELKKFSEVYAPAHLMPFLREIVGNTTMKANIPPLLLPPFNISEILKESKGKK